MVVFAKDLPMIVVQQHVMVSTQQHTVGYVSQPTSRPLDNVMHLARRGWLVAAGEDAGAVADGDCQSLRFTEQPVGAPQVDDLLLAIELDADIAGIADETLYCLAGDGLGVTLEVAVTARCGESQLSNDDTDGRATRAVTKPATESCE